MNNLEQMGNQENVTALAKKRALEYVNRGKLKEAIDSMVSDLGKDDSRPEEQKSMITMMGLSLRNQPTLSEQEVRDFIVGFTE
jgi:hypothetical protein